jgi:hypothetical protein
MPQTISSRLIDKIYELLTEYATEVNASNLSPSSKTDYVLFADQFVRWIDNDFTPGGTLNGEHK